MTRSTKIGRGLFAAAVVSVLGLGAAQAFAGTPAPTGPAFACDAVLCYRQCIANGIRSGRCIGGNCVCGV
jgi:hypothetical protein